MDARLQRRVQRYGWDKATPHYETGWRESLADAHHLLLKMANASAKECVLDVACGTGLVTFPLAESVGTQGSVVATDISEQMISVIKAKADQRNYCWIRSFRADAENLSCVENQSMDLATCALGLMYVANTGSALSEVHRALKPGGRAVFAVWGERRNCGWAEIFPIVDSRVHSEVCPLFFRLGTGSVLASEMSEVGFTRLEMSRISAVLRYATADDALQAAFVGGPVAMAYARFDEATRADVHAEYLDSIAPFLGEDGYEIPGEFVVMLGFKTP